MKTIKVQVLESEEKPAVVVNRLRGRTVDGMQVVEVKKAGKVVTQRVVGELDVCIER